MNPIVIFVAVLAIGLILKSVVRRPVQSTSEPLVVPVREGSDLTFGLDCSSLSPPISDHMPRRVRVRRVLHVATPSTVTVETAEGQLLGHLSGNDLAVALVVFNGLTNGLAQQRPTLAGRPLILDAAARINGLRLEIGIADPAILDID